jgi:hypothetical protein
MVKKVDEKCNSFYTIVEPDGIGDRISVHCQREKGHSGMHEFKKTYETEIVVTNIYGNSQKAKFKDSMIIQWRDLADEALKLREDHLWDPIFERWVKK